MARPSARKRGYNGRWVKASQAHLAANPWCVMCARIGIQTRATVVDHRVPHRGDWKLFWDKSNWDSLCGPHHNSAKQRDENRGYESGVTLDGRPIDPNHPWNRRCDPVG